MQTFLTSDDPYFAFRITAEQLDRQRLNKQALEAWQIMMTNLKLNPAGEFREPRGWYNHPATKMWRGHEIILGQYIDWMADEWRRRGYKTTIDTKANETLKVARNKGLLASNQYTIPWIQDTDRFESLASSHRTALLCKNYDWYSQFGWVEDTGSKPESYEYVWGMQ